MSDAVLTALFGILITVRCFDRSVQIAVGVVLAVLGLLGYGVNHFIR